MGGAVGDTEIIEIPPTGPAVLLHELDNLAARPNVLVAWIDGRTDFQLHEAKGVPPDGVLCLATDGVTRALGYEAIASIVRKAERDGARQLSQASVASAVGDDATAIVLDLPTLRASTHD